MDLGEDAVHLAGVEVGGIDPARPQLAGELEAVVEEVLARRREVVDEGRDVVEALLTRTEHVAVDRRRVIVLLDELEHRVAEVAEGVGDIGLLRRAAVGEPSARWWARMANGPAPNDDSTRRPHLEIVDHEGLLEERERGHDQPQLPAEHGARRDAGRTINVGERGGADRRAPGARRRRAAQLDHRLVDLAQPRGADRLAVGQAAAVGVDRQRARRSRCTPARIRSSCSPSRAEAALGQVHDLGARPRCPGPGPRRSRRARCRPSRTPPRAAATVGESPRSIGAAPG